MDIELSENAAEFGTVARKALEAAGGDALVQQAESDPDTVDVVERVLADLGAWDLDAPGNADEREAAAALCRSVGYWAAPYAAAERLAASDEALALILPCWTLLGMLDRAIELTVRHVKEREQFGQPLASFQSVQFQLTDAEVERVGLEELAKFALWSGDLADALAARLAAIEAAEIVFRVAHQLHGATGFCDETTLSWLSRYSQPLRRLPLGLSATRDTLTRTVGRNGLTGLFA
jgi:hypothetical protein